MLMISTDVVAHDELVQPIMPHFAQKSPCTLRGAGERVSSAWVSGAGERRVGNGSGTPVPRRSAIARNRARPYVRHELLVAVARGDVRQFGIALVHAGGHPRVFWRASADFASR